MPPTDAYRPDTSLLSLGEGFFDVVEPARFPRHVLRFRNRPWSERLGLGDLDDAAWLEHFARFLPLPANLERPLAMRYHGHQFGAYNPALGDGRGFTFAQLVDPLDGRLLELGTKGSGRTPWSRDGDGRLTLKGGVREVLATEMLEALGVRTSKTWSLVETGEPLTRGDEPSPTRSSVLVRLGQGHIRFGTFQRHAREGDLGRLERLLGLCVERWFPALSRRRDESTVEAFFRAVSRAHAALVASFMAAGFVHGVLNTDNMNVTGESFDYGPYRFAPAYDAKFVAAYFDHSGLYAFGRQPEVFRWNLERLADALALLPGGDRLHAALHDFEARVLGATHAAVLERLGLLPRDPIGDAIFVSHALCFLEHSRAGLDQFYFDWYGGAASEKRASASPQAHLYAGPRWEVLRGEIAGYAPSHPEHLADPYFAQPRPCSMLIDEIEAIWADIAERDDWTAFDAKIAAVRAMGAALGNHAGSERVPAAAAPSSG